MTTDGRATKDGAIRAAHEALLAACVLFVGYWKAFRWARTGWMSVLRVDWIYTRPQKHVILFGVPLLTLFGAVAFGAVLLYRHRNDGKFLPPRTLATYSLASLGCAWMVTAFAHNVCRLSPPAAYSIFGVFGFTTLGAPWLLYLHRTGKPTPLVLDALLVPVVAAMASGVVSCVRYGYDWRNTNLPILAEGLFWVWIGLPVALLTLGGMYLCRRRNVRPTYAFVGGVLLLVLFLSCMPRLAR